MNKNLKQKRFKDKNRKERQMINKDIDQQL